MEDWIFIHSMDDCWKIAALASDERQIRGWVQRRTDPLVGFTFLWVDLRDSYCRSLQHPQLFRFQLCRIAFSQWRVWRWRRQIAQHGAPVSPFAAAAASLESRRTPRFPFTSWLLPIRLLINSASSYFSKDDGVVATFWPRGTFPPPVVTWVKTFNLGYMNYMTLECTCSSHIPDWTFGSTSWCSYHIRAPGN